MLITSHRFKGLSLIALSILCNFTASIYSQQTSTPGNQTPTERENPLTRLSLHELQIIEVTSVSRKEENLLNAPSAIHVISSEDLERSGALHIPDALRMVPGFNVAQINANKWAISSRGFNSRFSNKMLVLMDGRTVYSPIFSGVHWDIQDTFLPDIEQIEAIRGPGATLWGANAVNGVISIQTKDASQTQGLYTMGVAGSEEFSGGLRYGGKLGKDAYYRVYVKGFSRDDFKRPATYDDAADEWWQQREGFRIDWNPSDQNHFTFQGDAYYNQSGDELTLTHPTPPLMRRTVEKAEATGGNFLSRWNRQVSEGADFSLQAYYDHASRENIYLNAEIDTFDLDFQNRITLGDRNELLWGAGYRLMSDELVGTYSTMYNHSQRNDQLFSFFAQDKIAVVEDRLFLTLGSKIEHNDYTGVEVQPGGRLAFKPTDNQILWLSVARAVRTPARFEHDAVSHVSAASNPNFRSDIIGNPNFHSEELVAYELGHRIQFSHEVSLDVASFYNDYDELRTREQTGPIVAGNPAVIPSTYENLLYGETYGFEITPSWQVNEAWKLSAGYSFLRSTMHKAPSSMSFTDEPLEGDSPRNQFHLRSLLDLPHNLQFDSALYYVDNLPNQYVSSYIRLDLRLAWRPKENLEVSVVAQNALDRQHLEFGSTTPLVTPSEVERSLYGKVVWHF